MQFDTIDDALKDLKLGKIIIVCDDENRENEGDFVALAEFITADTVNFMITHGRGLVCLPISQEIAQRLNLSSMVKCNTDNFNTAFTVSVDHKSNSTGISASDRCNTILQIIQPNAKTDDFRFPGHTFPLVAKNNGILERIGHTEAAVDLAKLSLSTPASVICEIINTDGTMAKRDQLMLIARQFQLKIITIKSLVEYRLIHSKIIKQEVQTNLATKFGNFKIFVYSNILDDKETVVLMKGELQSNTLVRIHSECITGDVFQSIYCDCGEQLEQAMAAIEKNSHGMIIYLRQEGRGIGLVNKLKSYNLQQKGYDTFDANIKLGFQADTREYFLAAQIIKDFNIDTIKLITNNPAKIAALQKYRINVSQRITLTTNRHSHNENYIKTKKEKFGHLF